MYLHVSYYISLALINQNLEYYFYLKTHNHEKINHCHHKKVKRWIY